MDAGFLIILLGLLVCIWQMEDVSSYPYPPYKPRPGKASTTNSCENIREVPEVLRKQFFFVGGFGISNNFYKQYTEAYNIPVLASEGVSDDGLKRACYVLRFLLADHSKIRESFYSRWGRVVVVAKNENTNFIPEQSFLPRFWDRDYGTGFGATLFVPISSVGEEQLTCRLPGQTDLLLRHLAYGIHQLAARDVLPDFESSLKDIHEEAVNGNQAIKVDMEEFFAKGTEGHFYKKSPKNPLNYDHWSLVFPKLGKLIDKVFPCKNTYITFCDESNGKVENIRDAEVNANLKMNCDLHDGDKPGRVKGTIGVVKPTKKSGVDGCTDRNSKCQQHVSIHFCKKKNVKTICCESCRELTLNTNMIL